MCAYCDKCERSFLHERALEQHLAQSYSHYYCFRCERNFDTPSALKHHERYSSNHHICRKCGDDYSEIEDLESHIRSDHFYCFRCQIFTDSRAQLMDHFAESPLHHYCESCRREFAREANLRSHLRSKLRVSQDLKCPGCTRRSRRFHNLSSMMIHLEAGTCKSGANRKKLNDFVHAADRNHIFTDRLLTCPDENGNKTTHATGAAWNGHAFECYFCPREFDTLTSLNQHLNSPVHEQSIYRCPGCSSGFKLFSGFLKHIESEACGISRFKEAKASLDSVTNTLRFAIAYH